MQRHLRSVEIPTLPQRILEVVGLACPTANLWFYSAMNTHHFQAEQQLSAENVETLQSLIGGTPSTWSINEIGDGNVNLIFRLTGPNGHVLIKQAVPYLRCVGESWPLSLKRNYFEFKALQMHSKIVPSLMPKVFAFNEPTAAMAMEYLVEHIILRKGMMAAVKYPNFVDHITEYMARTLFFTSDLALSAAEKKQNMKVFCDNTDLCKITEDLIFTDPYRNSEQNRWTSPQLDSLVTQLQSDTQLKIAVTEMKAKFLTQSQALIHGDLHSGSIMVTHSDTKVIDPEFAFYGPMAFDVGLLIGNFLLSYFSQAGWTACEGARDDYEQWVLEQTGSIWILFSQKFSRLWDEELTGDYVSNNIRQTPDAVDVVKHVRAQFMKDLLNDSIRFAACEMIRRILGLAHVADLDNIENPETRAICETRALITARELLVHGGRYASINDVLALARNVRHAQSSADLSRDGESFTDVISRKQKEALL